MTTQIPHFIDGQRSSRPVDRAPPTCYNPSTGEVQAQVLMASAADVDAAVAVAVRGADANGRPGTRSGAPGS